MGIAFMFSVAKSRHRPGRVGNSIAQPANPAIRELRRIPGVGPSIARDLLMLGIHSVPDLKGRDPQMLYDSFNRQSGMINDRCLLYVFRCAVYYASHVRHDPEKLKWWNWKDVSG